MKPIVGFLENEVDTKYWSEVCDLGLNPVYYRVDPEGPHDRVIPARITEQI